MLRTKFHNQNPYSVDERLDVQIPMLPLGARSMVIHKLALDGGSMAD